MMNPIMYLTIVASAALIPVILGSPVTNKPFNIPLIPPGPAPTVPAVTPLLPSNQSASTITSVTPPTTASPTLTTATSVSKLTPFGVSEGSPDVVYGFSESSATVSLPPMTGLLRLLIKALVYLLKLLFFDFMDSPDYSFE
ncbi:mucin-2 [Diachasma alloeum]|uniref:mucin-2 n=1 Tax=Diachasma alloeum TaxID=454923 RepID=UPI0007382FB5|nr:mucin-2 [Diachasma alloeum]